MKKLASLFLCLIFVLTAATCASAEISKTPYTEVSGGTISGYYNEDGTIAIFKGVPYAAAPVGDLRWARPQDVEAWNGVKDCTEFGKNEIQDHQYPVYDGSINEMWSYEYYIDTTLGYSEDCLTLNVWAKDDGVSGKPVLVYIPGGGNKTGGASCPVYDGEYIASQDVVYVCMNYRLGVFGNIALSELTGEQGASGNYGLQDQIKALEWVRDNIATFGGDPANVTIMGQSAGGQNVYLLTTSPLAKGLFTKAVAMSMPTMMTAKLPTMEEFEQTCLEKLGGRSLEELRALNGIDTWLLGYVGNRCIDNYVLEADYRDAVISGNENGVTLVSGYVANDCDLFGGCTATNAAEYEEFLVGRYGEENAAKLLELYPVTDETVRKVSVELANDGYAILQNYIAQARNANYPGQTYIYQMDRVMSGPKSDLFGAFHSSDVPYHLNYFDDYRADYWTEEDYAFGQIASGWLLNFCKNGVPAIDGVEWNASTGDYTRMSLDLESKMIAVPEDKVAFWTEYYNIL